MRELDRDRLVENYLHYTRNDILSDYRDEESNNYRRTIREIRRDHEEFIGEYVDRLRRLKITPSEDGSRGLLYTFKRIDELSECKPEPCFPYVNLEELLEQGEDATNYAYDLDRQSEIMGFLVSDDEYTEQTAEASHSTASVLGASGRAHSNALVNGGIKHERKNQVAESG